MAAVGAPAAELPALRGEHVPVGDLEVAPARVDGMMDVDAERKVQAEDAEVHVVGAVDRLQDAARHVGVEALVEPGLLELVGREEAVEVLVAGLVDRDALGALDARRRAPGGAARDQRRVLHPAGAAGAPGRVHDGQRGVGVGAEHAPVARERRLGRAEVTLGLARVLGLEVEEELHVAQTRPRGRRPRGRGNSGRPSTRNRARPPGGTGRGRGRPRSRALRRAGRSRRPCRGSAPGRRSRRRSCRSRRRTRSTRGTGGSSSPSPRRRRPSGTTARRRRSRPCSRCAPTRAAGARRSPSPRRSSRRARSGGRTTSATVRSFGLPSSGAMNVSAGRRSAPSEPVIRKISTEPHESGIGSPPRPTPWDSFQKVESVLRKAFRYRWNCSVAAGREVVFVHVRTSVPSMVFLSVSSRQVIWYEATGGGKVGRASGADWPTRCAAHAPRDSHFCRRHCGDCSMPLR